MSLTNKVEGNDYNDDDEDRLSSSEAVGNFSETNNDEYDLLIGRFDQRTQVASKKTLADMNESQTSNYSNSIKGKHFFHNILTYLNHSNQITHHQTDDNRKISTYNYTEDEEHFNIADHRSHSHHTGHVEESHRRRGVASSRRKKIRSLMIFCAALLLIVCSVTLLLKLITLIENYKLIIGYDDNVDRKGQLDHHHHHYHHNDSAIIRLESIETDQLEEGKASRWLISSSKCHIPVIDPWHDSIQGYVNLKPQVDCNKLMSKNQTSAPLTYVYNNRLYLTQRAIDMGAYMHCCVRQMIRVEDNDDDLEPQDTCHPIYGNGFQPPFELLKVECSQLNYTNAHSFIVHNLEEEAALSRLAARRLDEDQYYNVVMVGIDTISRLNGLRQLNKTLALLRERYNAIEFYGYNKVGENTFPNLIPLLSGLTPDQLTETQCWLATNYSQETEIGDDYLDNCKFLWNYYQELGYNTFFNEDWPKASTFNYLKQGFKHKPTAYYGRPYTISRDNLLLPKVNMGCSLCQLDRPLVEIDLDVLKTFIQEQNQKPFFSFSWINCPPHDDLNGASQVDLIIEKFFKDVHKLTQDDRTFVIFLSDHGYRWNDFVSTRVGHYESSLPMLFIAPPKRFLMNHPDLAENMRRHKASLLTPFDMFKTLLDIRNLGMKLATGTDGGRNSISRKNLRNKRIAVTKHTTESPTSIEGAIFTTVPTATTTVKQLKLLTGETYQQKFKTFSIIRHYNTSELDRSCIEAGIPDNYCVCHEFEKVKASDLDVVGAAHFLVHVHLYTRLKNFENLCHPLDLQAVHEAELYDFKQMKSASTMKANERRKRKSNVSIFSDDYKNPATRPTTPKPEEQVTAEQVIDEHHYLPNREYNIRVSTKPGGALFQEVVRFYGKSIDECRKAVRKMKELLEKNSTSYSYSDKSDLVMDMNEVCKFSIHSDSISRLNLYKDQSKCVKSNIELKKICYCKNL